MSELKPCPFCGASPEISEHYKGGMYSLLHRCKVVGPIMFNWGDRERHIARWNTRALLPKGKTDDE